MNFEFNEEGMRRFAEEAVAKVAADGTRELELVYRQYAGRPVEEIRPALEELFARVDWDLGEEHLAAFAEAIHEGRRVELKSAPIEWSR